MRDHARRVAEGRQAGCTRLVSLPGPDGESISITSKPFVTFFIA